MPSIFKHYWLDCVRCVSFGGLNCALCFILPLAIHGSTQIRWTSTCEANTSRIKHILDHKKYEETIYQAAQCSSLHSIITALYSWTDMYKASTFQSHGDNVDFQCSDLAIQYQWAIGTLPNAFFDLQFQMHSIQISAAQSPQMLNLHSPGQEVQVRPITPHSCVVNLIRLVEKAP